MSTAKHSATTPFGPSAPQLTLKNLRDQFWADVYGKEVQTTATYSYTWVADQFGHICLGLIGNFAATALCGVVMTFLGWSHEFHYDTGKWPGLVIVSVGAAVWEWFAYNKSVDEATKRFPLDTALLRDNAQVAAGYMILGGVLGFAFHHCQCSCSRCRNPSCTQMVAAENHLAEGGTSLSVSSRGRSANSRPT